MSLRPPQVPFTLLARALTNDESGPAILGDLQEAFEELAERSGVRRARFWYTREAVSLAATTSARNALVFVSKIKSRDTGNLEMGRGWEMGSWIKDLRIAARSLARRPGFALGVALTLALGIGATTTIYSVVDGVMLRPLPYNDASKLVAVGSLVPGAEWVDGETGLQDLAMISLPNYRDFGERTRSFDNLAALEPNRMVIPDVFGNGPEIVAYANVSPGLFEMLGVSPALGRSFLPEEYSSGSEEVVILSYGAWQRRYGGDTGVVGRAMMTGGSVTVVGILPRDFTPPEAFFPTGEAPEFWYPIWADASNAGDWYNRRRGRLYLLGHLDGATSVEQARAEAGRIASALAAEFPDDNVESDGSAVGIGVNGLRDQTVGATGKALGLFLGAAGLLLLLAAMNAATLLLARSLDRTQELGVRMALGAGRARVVRLLVSEAGILSLVGGALGVLLAYGGVDVFLRNAPSSIPRLTSVAVDARVLAVAALVSLGTGIAVGLLPALRLTRRGAWQRLQGAGRSFVEPSSRLRGVLVFGQLAVAVVLLSGAGLLFSSFVRISTVDPGFEADGLIAMGVSTKGGAGWNFQAQWIGWDRIIDELRAVPGVESVAAASNVPFQAPRWAPRLLLPGDTPEKVRGGIAGYTITPGYLETMGTALLKGRDFERLDGPEAERVVLVNESFVRTQLGGGDPIDVIVRWSAGTEWSAGDEWIPPAEWLVGEATPLRIVGLVEDVVQAGVEEGPRAAIYIPYTQGRGGPVAVIRTALPPEAIVPDLLRAAARFNPGVPVVEIGTMEDRMAAGRTTPRFQTMLIGAFALVAMLLAAAGLYGSLAHSVGRRQRELGIRMALGADRAGVLRMVLGQGMRWSMAGLAVGMIAALFVMRLLASFLYGVEPNDPATLLAVGGVMALVSAAACLAPARRATAVDPVTVLKAE